MALVLGSMNSTNTATAIGTSYDTAKAITLEYVRFGTSKITILASMLEIQFANISGATKITACLSREPQGDDFVLTSTQSTIEAGLTTSSKGTALIRLDVILRDVQDQVLYLHTKTDAGTLDISSAALTYQQ